jgi:hypothetical protein
MEWLMASLSGNASHHIAPWAVWHARWMVLAWAVLLPLGVLIARFFKVLPRQNWPQEVDNIVWWHTHRTLQWAGFACMLVGLWLVWGKGASRGTLPQLHAGLGLLVCALAAVQVLGALARGTKGGPTESVRRGDHYDMTARRRVFERLHKGLGWLAVVLAVAVMALGLVAVDAPRWMVLVLASWWLALVAAFVRLQRTGRCVDTYQAIWGPDPNHPGNGVRPIGWGIVRATAFRGAPGAQREST